MSARSEIFPGLGEPECAGKDSNVNTVKLFACLNGDTSRLFDYCTGGLVFDDIGRLILCLKLIHGDSSVQILRLKNSFHDGTLGYRYAMLLEASLRMVPRANAPRIDSRTASASACVGGGKHM